jgi:hypothetical protein
MVYLKSFLAGLGGLSLAAILFPFVSCTLALFSQSKHRAGPDAAVSWDLRSALGSSFFRWSYVVTVALFFVIAFLWEFRRASR